MFRLRWLLLPAILILSFAVTAQPERHSITPENADTLTLAATLVAHELPVNDLTYAPDGDRLLSASDDLTAIVWNMAEAAPEILLDGQLNSVRAVDISPDGETALTTGFNGLAVLWDLRSVTRAASFNAPDFPSMNGAAFSPDGEQIAVAVGTGEVALYDAETQEPTRTLRYGDALAVDPVAFSPDGSRLIAGYGFPADSAVVWDTATGDILFSLGSIDGKAEGVAIAPDGVTTAVGSSGGDMVVWSLPDETSMDLMTDIPDAHSGGVFDLAFSPDGVLLASVGFDGALRVWDVETGEQLVDLRPTDAPRSLLAVAWEPSGTQIAVAGETGDIYLYGLP